MKPHLRDDEFKVTEGVVKEFQRGVGPKLQALLEQRAANTENWVRFPAFGMCKNLLHVLFFIHSQNLSLSAG